jgi:hypothetical protein
MIGKAFTATSEGAIVVTSPKGKLFKYKMFNIYSILLKEQELWDNQQLSSTPSTVAAPVYESCSPHAIHDRFKLMSHKCSKRHGCEKTTAMESDWDKVNFNAVVDYHLEQKWPKLGSKADIRVCYDYLKGKSKQTTSMESQTPAGDNHSDHMVRREKNWE